MPIVTSLVNLVQHLFDQQASFANQQQEFLTKLEAKLNAAPTPSLAQILTAPPPNDENKAREVVLGNIPESTADTATQRAAADLQAVREMLDIADVEAIPVSVFRMGKKSQPNPRLLKVVMSNSSASREFLRNRGTFRKIPNLKSIFIRPSLTKQQLETRWKLLAEKNRLNAELSETEKANDRYIVYGPPDDLKLIKRSELKGRGAQNNDR
jgi:hypothetical protein